MSQTTEDGSEVIGYELELPWLQDLFGPTSTMRQRVCLPCYGALGGVREKTLTRQGVEDKCAALRAQGMTNFGGTDLCWRCGKNLLTGKRPAACALSSQASPWTSFRPMHRMPSGISPERQARSGARIAATTARSHQASNAIILSWTRRERLRSAPLAGQRKAG